MAPTLRPRPTRTDFWQPLDFNVSTGRSHSTANRSHSVSTRRNFSDPRRRTRSVQPPERVDPDPHHGVEARARTSGRSSGTFRSEARRRLRRQTAGSSRENIRQENIRREIEQISGHSAGTFSPEEDPSRRPSGAVLIRSPRTTLSRTTLSRMQLSTRTETPSSVSGSSNSIPSISRSSTFSSSTSGSSTRQERQESIDQRRRNRKRSRRVGDNSTSSYSDESDPENEGEEEMMVLEPGGGLWIPSSQVARQTSSSASGGQSSIVGQSPVIDRGSIVGQSSVIDRSSNNTSPTSRESINPGSEVPIRQRLRSRTSGATFGSGNESRSVSRTGVSVVSSTNNGSNSTPINRTRSDLRRVLRPSTASQRSGSSTSGSRTGSRTSGMTVDGILSIADRSRTGIVSISGSKKAKRSESSKSGAKEEKVAKYGSSSTCTICLNQVQDLAVLVPCRHEFDNRCIDTWFKEKRNCPVCRTLVTKIRVNYRSESEFTEKEVPPLVHDWNRIGQMAPMEMAVFLEHVQDLRNVQSSLHRLQTARYHINITLSQL